LGDPIFCMPHPDPGSRLVGRAGLLKELDHRLSDGADPVLLTALQGTGGIGKTQLAARYCWAYRHRYSGGIVWTNMADPKQAPADLASWAEKHPDWFGVDSNTDVRGKAQAVLGRIQNQADALLVLDNVIQPSVLDHDLPGLPNTRPRNLGCKVLITSREHLPDCASIRVDFLPAPADRALLLREARRPEPQGADTFGLARLLAMLGGLPLALVMTGRLLAGKEMGFERLANILEQKGAVRVLAKRGAIPADYHEKIGSSLQAVLSEVWDALPSDQPHLKRLMMAVGSLGENVFVPEAALPFLVKMPAGDPEWDEDPLEDTLARLDMAQLIERNRERQQIRLHPLIRDFARDHRDGAFTGGLAATVAQHLGTAEYLLATPASSLAEIALALGSFASMDGGAKDDTGAIGTCCRILRLGAHWGASGFVETFGCG
jgi:NB-ARC domain